MTDAPPTAAPPRPARRRGRRPAHIIAAFLLSAGVLIVLALSLVLGTEAGGLAFFALLRRFGGEIVLVEGWRGRIISDWQADRMVLRFPGSRIDAYALSVSWRASGLFRRDLLVHRFHAGRIVVRSTPSDDKRQSASVPPKLPIALRVEDLRISELAVGELRAREPQLPPHLVFRSIDGRFLSNRQIHRVERFSLQSPWGHLSGAGQLALQAPYALQAKLRLASRLEGNDVGIQAEISGEYARPRVRAKAQGQGLNGEAALDLQPFAPVPLARARLQLNGLDPAAFQPGAPRARLDVSADLRPQGQNGDWRSWRISGPLVIVNHEPARMDADGIPVARAELQLNWAAGLLQAGAVRVQLAGGGELRGEASWRPEESPPLGRIEGKFRLSEVDPNLIHSAARPMRISGDASATSAGGKQVFVLDLRSGEYKLAARGEHQEGRLRLADARLAAGQGSLALSGEMGVTGDRLFNLQGSLAHLNPRAFSPKAAQGDLNARFSLRGQAAGPWQVQGRLDVLPSRLAGQPLAGGGRIGLAAGRLFDTDFRLNAMDNRIELKGGFGRPEDELRVRIDAPQLARLHAALGGTLQANLTLRGGAALDALAGEFSVDAGNLRWQDMRLTRLVGQGSLQAGASGAVSAKLEVGALGGTEAGGAPTLRQARVGISGRRNAHTLDLSADILKDQSIALVATGGWTQGAWSGVLERFSAEGPVRFALVERVALTASPGRVSLAPARLQAQNGSVELLQTEWRAEGLVARGRITGVEVGLALDEQLRTVLRGRTLRLGGEWDIRLAERANGLVRIYREGGDLLIGGDAPVALGLETLEATIAAQDDRLTASVVANGTRMGAVSFVGSAATVGRGTAIRLNPTAPLVGVGSVQISNIDWIGPLLQQDLRTAGSVRGEFNILGTSARPQSQGRITGERLEIGLADEGLRLVDGRLALSFDAERVRLENFDFLSANVFPPPDARLRRAGFGNVSGTLTGSGELQLTTGKGRFALRADRVAALQRHDRWMLLSGTADIETGWQDFYMNARLKADAAYIGVPKGGAPKLSDDVVIRGAPAKEKGMRVNADILFDTGPNFLLRAYGIDTWLAGQLKLRMDDEGDLIANGSIRAREGVFEAYGQKLTIDRGVVSFQGPIENPGLNVVALRKGLPVEAGVEVTGSARAPRVRLVSEPNVPESEKLSWLLLGRASDMGQADSGLLLSAASAALGGGEGEGVVERIASSIGLDEIQVVQSSGDGVRPLRSQVASSATGLSAGPTASATTEQVLMLGKRLSSRAYLAFEQNFIGTESVVKLSYTLTRFLSLVARAGTDNAVDLRYTISFR